MRDLILIIRKWFSYVNRKISETRIFSFKPLQFLTPLYTYPLNPKPSLSLFHNAQKPDYPVKAHKGAV